jgi:hypothetical protein
MTDEFSWMAVYRDGTTLERFVDGAEQTPDYDRVAEFHLLPAPNKMRDGARPYSLFLRRNERLIFFRRVHGDTALFANGSIVPYGRGDPYFVLGIGIHEFVLMYVFVLPEGRVEMSTDHDHVTRYERNGWAHPLRFYETWPLPEIPGHPGEEARWPGDYDRPIPVPTHEQLLDPRKIDPPLPEGFERNAKEFEADAIVAE